MRKLLLLILFFTFTPCVLLAAIVNLSYYSFQKHASNNFISLTAHASALPISYAALPTTDSQLVGSIEVQDGRALKLKNFLHAYGSPLEEFTNTFITDADTYGFDYRLLVAIAMQESIGGKRIVAGTNNPFGWGINSKQTIGFSNYGEAIDTVSKAFAKNYIQKGRTTPAQIGPIWNPKNTDDWIGKVTYFMNQINATL